jgi:integrase
MTRDGRRDLPKGITPKLRKHGTRTVPVTTADGTPVYRVRLWDPVLKRQIERTSGASDIQVAHQMGHSRIETTKNIYGHLFAQDRTSILDAMNQAVSRLYAYEDQAPETHTAA